MASIKKRRGTFSVVYTYENENGEKKQRWETFKTYAEAHKRRAEIEYKQNEGTFLPPNKQTVEEIMKDYEGHGGFMFVCNVHLCISLFIWIFASISKSRQQAERPGRELFR